jgi:hypothetical protein
MTDPTSTRLDKQAAAIKRLRADRDALLTRIEALEAQVLAPSTPVHPEPGFTMPPTCPMCDGPREPGRKTLTCATCSALRNKIIHDGLDRTPIIRDSCCSCGASFSASARFLCTKCSAAFKIWKAAQ